MIHGRWRKLVHDKWNFRALANDHLVLGLHEVVCRHLQVEGRGTLAHPSRDIVVRPVAGTKPSTKVASFANWHTTQMSADAWPWLAFLSSPNEAKFTQHDQPLRPLHSVRISLRIPQ